jgi:hypothetical protein
MMTSSSSTASLRADSISDILTATMEDTEGWFTSLESGIDLTTATPKSSPVDDSACTPAMTLLADGMLFDEIVATLSAGDVLRRSFCAGYDIGYYSC